MEPVVARTAPGPDATGAGDDHVVVTIDGSAVLDSGSGADQVAIRSARGATVDAGPADGGPNRLLGNDGEDTIDGRGGDDFCAGDVMVSC